MRPQEDAKEPVSNIVSNSSSNTVWKKMTATSDLIRTVLIDHPEYESYEEVQAECIRRGTKVGVLHVYHVAKVLERKLERRPKQPNIEEDIYYWASTLTGFHDSLADTIATLDDIGKRNENGIRIPWEIEKTEADLTETWELSVGQELVDLCGSVDRAIEAVQRAWGSGV